MLCYITFFQIRSSHITFSHTKWRHIILYHIISNHFACVILNYVVFHNTILYYIVSCEITSYIVSHNIISYHIWSNDSMSYYMIWYDMIWVTSLPLNPYDHPDCDIFTCRIITQCNIFIILLMKIIIHINIAIMIKMKTNITIMRNMKTNVWLIIFV